MSHDSHKQILALSAMVFAIAVAVGLGGMQPRDAAAEPAADWLAAIERGDDHIDAEELAARVMAGGRDLALVDLRPADEYEQFHLPGAVRMTVPEVVGARGDALFAGGDRLVVLYSNGPAHPGQAWVELRRRGRTGVRVLDGGLEEFKTRILTPPALRRLVDEETAGAEKALFELRAAFFLSRGTPGPPAGWAADPDELTAPTMVSARWLASRLDRVAVVDVRPRQDYAALHVPGAVHLHADELRQRHGDRPLLLESASRLAERFGRLGITASTPVVLVFGERMHDATLVALAFLRAGHRALAILDGGILGWAAARLPLVGDMTLPAPVRYEPLPAADDFTIEIDDLAGRVAAAGITVLDVRAPEFFRGDKSTEARPGHVPGAVNRPLELDLVRRPDGCYLRPRDELLAEYRALGLSADDPIAVSCRTGHSASETFFVLRYLLGYRDVKWFNGSWTQWAERLDLPAAVGEGR